MLIRVAFAAMLAALGAALVAIGADAILHGHAEVVERTTAGVGCLAASSQRVRTYDGVDALLHGASLAGLGLVLAHWAAIGLLPEGSRWIRLLAASSALCLLVCVGAAFPPWTATASALAFWSTAAALLWLAAFGQGRGGRLVAAALAALGVALAPTSAAVAALALLGAAIHAGALRPRDDPQP